MSKLKLPMMAVIIGCLAFYSCQEETAEATADTSVPEEVIAQLNELGFNTDDFPVFMSPDDKYVYTEGDIVLSVEDLMSNNIGLEALPDEEHYSTDEIVTGTPRTISVYVSSSFSSNYFDAADEAISRYNALNLSLTFQRVTSSSSADISINPSPWYYYFFGILGSAGFPSGGDPYDEILMTEQYYDDVTGGPLATTIAHEMGHCLGFRHTDYMDRSYSCGGSAEDEGASDVGANHIPGTPEDPDAGSWMLSCSSTSTDRPFTANDIIALDYLY